MALRIEKLCRRWNIKLEIFWISRDKEQIEYCDKVSKEFDMSDYWISYKDLLFSPEVCCVGKLKMSR